MAQFDCFRDPDNPNQLLVDCQSDLIESFVTRLVVPLVPIGGPKPASDRLHPVVSVNGDSYIFATQLASAVPANLLQRRECTLADHRDRFLAALDMLLTGF